MSEASETEGHLLGGRLRYAQFRRGFRTGIEPVFLAAAIPARRGQSVLEAGTGAGAAAMCLALRLPSLAITAVERDPDMVALARRNIAANGFSTPPVIVEADIVGGEAFGMFDHACANPPWHHAVTTASPDARRDSAKRASPGLLVQWTKILSGCLRPRGTLTLIMPASALTGTVAALAEAGCGAISLLPLWPKQGTAARIVLVQAVRGGAGPSRILPGLVLHEPDGGYTAAAEAILRDGEALAQSG